MTTSAESKKQFSPANDQRILQATVLHCILVPVRLLWKVSIKLLLGQFQVNSSRDEVLHPLINIYFKQWCCALPWIELNCREKYHLSSYWQNINTIFWWIHAVMLCCTLAGVKLPWKLRDASAAAPPWSAAFVRKCICEEETGIFNSDRCCFLWQGVMERTSCCMHMQAINWKSIIFCESGDIQNSWLKSLRLFWFFRHASTTLPLKNCFLKRENISCNLTRS